MKIFTVLSLSICVFIFSSNILYGQGKKDKNRRTNYIEAGYVSSLLSNDNEKLGDNTSGFYFSLYKEVKILPLIHFGSGFSYIQNGTEINTESLQKYIGDGEFQENDKEVSLSYLTVPFHITAKIGPVAGYIGCSGSYRISAKINNGYDSRDFENKSYFNKWDAALLAGLRIHIVFIGIDLRYNKGLVNVFDGYHQNYYQAGVFFAF